MPVSYTHLDVYKRQIFAPRNNKKIEYFEAVKGVSFEVEKGQILGCLLYTSRCV